MLVNIKVNGETLYNVSVKEAIEHFQVKEEEILPQAKTELEQQLLQHQKQRLQKILNDYGYIDLSDAQFYANQNDEEAKAILNWYSTYDDLIWQYIDNDLQEFTNIEELLQIDMKNIEQQIYEQSIATSPLP